MDSLYSDGRMKYLRRVVMDKLMKQFKKDQKKYNRVRNDLFDMFQEHFDDMRSDYILMGKNTSTDPKHTEARAGGLWDGRECVLLDRMAGYAISEKCQKK